MVKKLLVLGLLVVAIANPGLAAAQPVRTGEATTLPATVEKQPVRTMPLETTTGEVMQQRGQNLREAAQDRVQAFRAQIQNIKDARKQGIVENIAEKVTSANSRITGKMSMALDKLTTILERVEARAEALSATGQNTTALMTAIVGAEEAISAAKTAVDEQAQKQYTADITDELTLRNTIGAMVSEFRTDITTVHEAVIAAKQAVVESITEANQLQEGSSNDATESATIE